jgi:hypothetical protein
MNQLLNSFWRAAAHCWHPRVILLSLLPLLLLVGAALGLGYFLWEPANEFTRRVLESFTSLDVVWSWLDGVGLPNLKMTLVPLLVIFVSTPVLVIACLLLVALMMVPSIVNLVSNKRFPDLEKKRGGSWWRSMWVSVGSTFVALTVLIVSIPLWLIPPVILVLPPLIWGWLTYRVMSFDAMAEHASPAERKAIISKHRGPLLVMGLVCGYLGAAPGLVWASGTFFAVLFPVLVPAAIWLYTLVFAFSALWFTHYCLAALAQLRQAEGLSVGGNPSAPDTPAPELPRPTELVPAPNSDPLHAST